MPVGIVLFHNCFPLTLNSPNNVLLISQNNQLLVVYFTFHKYSCYIKRWGITTNLNIWNPLGYVIDMPRCECVEHGLEYVTFYVPKTYITFGGRFWSPAGSPQIFVLLCMLTHLAWKVKYFGKKIVKYYGRRCRDLLGRRTSAAVVFHM